MVGRKSGGTRSHKGIGRLY